MKINAYAKLNLTLEVVGKRKDGFHNIKSLFQRVSLHDEIEIEKSDSLDIKCIPDVCSNNNTVYKAYELFSQESSVKDRVRIKIKKYIPCCAGLGGGSSDAAASLILMNELFGKPLNDNRLIKIGGQIGADVPFFFNGSTALVEGKGEEVYSLTPIKKFYVLIVIPKFSISTRDAYEKIDSFQYGRTNYTENILMVLKKNYSLKDLEDYLHNDFEEMYKREDERFLHLFKELFDRTKKNFHLTGSGSALFAMFDDKTSAQKTQEKLDKEFTVVQCQFI